MTRAVAGLGLGLALASLAACATTTTSAPSIANRAAPPHAEPVPMPPISHDDIARARVPPTLDAFHQLVVGRWDGKHYDYDGDSAGFQGEAGDSPRRVLSLDADGRYTVVEDECETAGHYTLESEPRDGPAVSLRLFRERTCTGDPPYNFPSTIHRLDGGILVLVDGITAGVSAYRRAR